MAKVMTTQNSAMGDAELHRQLIDALSGTTFGFNSSQLEAILPIIKSRDQQIALAAEEKLLLRLKDSGDLNEMQSSYWLSTIDSAKSRLKQAQNKEK